MQCYSDVTLLDAVLVQQEMANVKKGTIGQVIPISNEIFYQARFASAMGYLSINVATLYDLDMAFMLALLVDNYIFCTHQKLLISLGDRKLCKINLFSFIEDIKIWHYAKGVSVFNRLIKEGIIDICGAIHDDEFMYCPYKELD
jgi:hypothetical protein